jgi:hypothetical protein
MYRFGLAGLTIALCSNLALGESADCYCKVDDNEGVITCFRVVDSMSIFRYNIANMNIMIFSDLSSTDGASLSRQRCLSRAEQFRQKELEDGFNDSLDGLRVKAEGLRKSSEDNLNLYKQLMLIYYGLRGRYRDGLQAYRDEVKKCNRNTPYDVRPDHA